jgi:hypothetical protein
MSDDAWNGRVESFHQPLFTDIEPPITTWEKTLTLAPVDPTIRTTRYTYRHNRIFRRNIKGSLAADHLQTIPCMGSSNATMLSLQLCHATAVFGINDLCLINDTFDGELSYHALACRPAVAVPKMVGQLRHGAASDEGSSILHREWTTAEWTISGGADMVMTLRVPALQHQFANRRAGFATRCS